jgi:hypothetical protein
MNAPTIVAIGLLGCALAGCETLNGPQAVANADAQREQCKAVVSTNTADSMRLANHRPVETNEMKQAEATLATGRIKNHEPAAIRDDQPGEQTLTAKTLRDC